jgi:3-oxoadipate enol-lactonase
VIPHYRATGPDDAAPLLMGESLGTNLKMWEGQLQLVDRWRLIRYDHRGHGGSSTPPGPYEIADLARDALELMDALEISRASYCGLSIGGMVGMWLAAHAPERIDRLVLMCTSAHMPPPSAWQQRAAAVLEAESTEPIADTVVAGWLTPGYAALHPEVRAALRAMLTATSPDGYASCCGAIERMDLRADLPSITAPTLIISGSEDPSTPREIQEQIAAAISGARHEVVGPAAHIAAVEQPDRVNQLVEEHLS